MAALRLHQHRVDDMRITLPFPPRTLGPSRHVRRVTALQHDAFDSIGVSARRGRIGANRREIAPCSEGDLRRKLDTGIVKRRDEINEPPPPVFKWQLAQIIVAAGEQIVGAQVNGTISNGVQVGSPTFL